MEYNTARAGLPLIEYGRGVQQMVAHLKTIEDKETRSRAAGVVVQVMGTLVPQPKDQPDYKHKLWDHLYMLADFDLDIESPYPAPSPEIEEIRPEKPSYGHRGASRFRFYGHQIPAMLKAVARMEEGSEKESALNAVASYMRFAYGKAYTDKMPDELLLHHIEELSGAQLKPTRLYDLNGPDLNKMSVDAGGRKKKNFPKFKDFKKGNKKRR